jgi:hypothetical protein
MGNLNYFKGFGKGSLWGSEKDEKGKKPQTMRIPKTLA